MNFEDSVFFVQVEYRPHYSDVPIEAAAEAPREALPIGCRPGFSAVWHAKERFQVIDQSYTQILHCGAFSNSLTHLQICFCLFIINTSNCSQTTICTLVPCHLLQVRLYLDYPSCLASYFVALSLFGCSSDDLLHVCGSLR